MDKKAIFLHSYAETALWSSIEGDEPLDKNFSFEDIAPETWDKMKNDCTVFLEANEHLLDFEYIRAGHDFWLTRNGHGAGFWDGDWPEPNASELTKAAKEFGEVTFYIGDDGQIYQA